MLVKALKIVHAQASSRTTIKLHLQLPGLRLLIETQMAYVAGLFKVVRLLSS